MSDQVLHIAIDVSCADDELRGRVSDGVQTPRAFSGWLGLIGALDAMMGSLRQDGVTSSPGMADLARNAQHEAE